MAAWRACILFVQPAEPEIWLLTAGNTIHLRLDVGIQDLITNLFRQLAKI